MTKGLPATMEDAEMAAVEAVAVAHARCHVRRLKSGEISAQPLELRDSEAAAPWSWFGREHSRAWVKARLKADALNPQKASYVCRLARAGWTVADEALREIIVEHKEHDEKLLTSLRAYDIEITRTAGRPSGGGWTQARWFSTIWPLPASSPRSAVCSACLRHVRGPRDATA